MKQCLGDVNVLLAFCVLDQLRRCIQYFTHATSHLGDYPWLRR